VFRTYDTYDKVLYQFIGIVNYIGMLLIKIVDIKLKKEE